MAGRIPTQCDLLVACKLCGKPVGAATDCWRGSIMATDRVHVLCLAAIMLMGESPSRLDHEVVDDVNGSANELCAELCQNPNHIH